MLKQIKFPPALTIATGVYLLCSLFALVLYPILPPVLSSVGSRIHFYLLVIAAFEGTTPFLTGLILAAHAGLIAMLWFGIRAIRTGRCKIYCALVGLDILLTFSLHFIQDIAVADYTAGVWVNLAYLIWLVMTVRQKSNEPRA